MARVHAPDGLERLHAGGDAAARRPGAAAVRRARNQARKSGHHDRLDRRRGAGRTHRRALDRIHGDHGGPAALLRRRRTGQPLPGALHHPPLPGLAHTGDRREAQEPIQLPVAPTGTSESIHQARPDLWGLLRPRHSAHRLPLHVSCTRADDFPRRPLAPTRHLPFHRHCRFVSLRRFCECANPQPIRARRCSGRFPHTDRARGGGRGRGRDGWLRPASGPLAHHHRISLEPHAGLRNNHDRAAVVSSGSSAVTTDYG